MDLKACQVIELDSCTEEKFSRHIVIRLPGLAFCTNAHVGAFVRRVVAGLPQCPATGDCSVVTGPAAGQLGITPCSLQPATASGRQINPDGTAQAEQDREAAPSSAEPPQQPSELAATEPMLPLPGKGCGVLQAEVGPADWAVRTAAIQRMGTLALTLAQQLDVIVMGVALVRMARSQTYFLRRLQDEQDDAEALELVAALESKFVSEAHCRRTACHERLLVLKVRQALPTASVSRSPLSRILTTCRCHVQDAGGAKTSFADLGVYTRNRAFRLFLSSKAGKQSILMPTGEGTHETTEVVACLAFYTLEHLGTEM